MATAIHPVDEMLPAPKLFTLGLQHVLVMYAGAIAVPLIIGRALQLPPEDVAFLISADLFCCGVVSILQSLGFTPWFGVRMPVMMGVTFASVGPMVSIALVHPGAEGARMIFGSIIAAGVIGVLIAPIASRMLRFFPPVVTGTIILVIGITLMRVGINWIFGTPVGPTAPHLVSPEHAAWLEQVTALGGTVPPPPAGFRPVPTLDNPAYAPISNIILSMIVLGVVMVIARFAKGFLSNIAVLLGIITGGVIAAALGMMHFDKIAEAAWFAPITPFHFGTPIFEPVLIITMTLVMIVTLIEFDRHVPRALRPHRLEADPAAPLGRAQDGRARHDHRRRVQHLPLHVVLAERRARRRHRRPLALRLRRRRRHHGGARADPEDGGAGRGAADGGARRRGDRDVRDGRGDRHPHPAPGRLRRPTATTCSSSRSRSVSG